MKHAMNRRTFAAGIAGALAAPMIKAQTLPAGPIRIVVGFAPGGGTDAMARAMAQRLGELWKVPVVVENRPGAAGVIAAEYVAKQPADGTTLLMTNFSNHAVAPHLYPKIGYVVERDFAPIMLVGITPCLLIGRPSQGARTVSDVVEQCRQQPGRISFASAGNGSVQHMALEMFKLNAKVDAVHVPYRGSGPLMTDLLGGQVQFSFETMPSATPHISSGKVVAIAQTGRKRAAAHAGVPTMAEAGFAGFDASTWYGLVGPAQLPAALARRLNEDCNKVLAMPDIVEKLAANGAEDGGGSIEKFARFIKSEKDKWGEVVRNAKISI